MDDASNPAPVAVVIPCRNMAANLGRALNSVFDQIRPPAEVIVIDDLSTDDPAAVVARFGGRVRLLAGPGKGSAIARNLGILSTSAEFVAFLDADDYWRPGHLRAALSALADPPVGLTCCNWQHSTDGHEGEPLFGTYYTRMQAGSVFSALLRENWVLTSSVVIRRRLLALSGLFDPELVGAQDYDLWLRLARVTEFACIREAYVVKHGHAGNITASPKYAYHLARVWSTIRARYTDLPPEEAAYVRSREAGALYGAGLQAIRDEDYAQARHYLARCWRMRPVSRRHTVTLAAACLPAPVVRALRAMKRRRRAKT